MKKITLQSDTSNTSGRQRRFQGLLLALLVVCFSTFFVPELFAENQKESNSSVAKLIDKPFYQAVENSHHLADRFQEQLGGFAMLPSDMAKTWQQVAKGHVGIYPILLMIQICFVIAIAMVVELLFRRRFKNVYDSLGTTSANNFMSRLSCRTFAVALEVLFLCSFLLVTFCLFVLILPEKGMAAMVASNYMLAAYYLRMLLFCILLLLAPARPSLRMLPFSDTLAKFLFGWLCILCTVEIFLARSTHIMRRTGADESTLLALSGVVIGSSVIMFMFMIRGSRQQVKDALCKSEDETASPSLACQLADHWQLLAFSLLFFITLIWEIRVLGSGKMLFGKIIVGFLAIPFFISFEIWGGKLLNIIFTKPPSTTGKGVAFLEKTGLRKYSSQIQFIFRVLLLALLFFFLLGLFKLDLAIGRMFTAGVLSSVFIVIMLSLAWQFFSGWVDRKIREEMPDDEEADEGGKGGSRRGTLLLLLRKFVMIILVIIAAMLILSALGLNIAPLVAGAGILGLAVSFGAQSLVTDIFSGIFFLIDDAFRVGDYIDTGTAKGLVEHISLRAVRLRHHRGMVQTVPFGKIGTVVNYSRDYIIMKLDFRVKYDTDVDKVRKIVKKIYQQVLADEELGPKLLGKIKSQGVLQMEDSAMIMRIKFTTPPGEQFVMRKEILRRLQEAFGENDIEFAHRNVTVYMPQQEGKDDVPAEVQQGAATAAILHEEEEITRDRGDVR